MLNTTRKILSDVLGIHRGYGPDEDCCGVVYLMIVLTEPASGCRMCAKCGSIGVLCRLEEELSPEPCHATTST